MPGPRVREKCFLHYMQTSFLHAGKMFFTASTGTRRKPLARRRRQGHGLAAEEQRPSGEGMACGQRQRPAAGTPCRANEQRPGGRSCTAIKIKDDGATAANRAPQSSCGGWTGKVLARARSCCPCRCCLLPAAWLLLPAPCCWLWSLALALALPVPDQGRAGVPMIAKRAWGKADMGRPPRGGLRPGDSGHTLRIPAGV